MNKISILLLTLTIYAVYAEPLRNRQQQLRQLSRQEATTEQEETTEPYAPASPSTGPYAPSGWKPSGQLLVLPSRQQQQQQQYGPPQQYGTPTTEYGPPDDVSTTAEASDSSDSNETTDEPDSESVNLEGGPSQVQANFNQPQQQQPGYFVQLADGSIQRVLYVSSANNAVGAAKLQVQPAVQARPVFVQPFYVPQAVSFSSQYQSW